MTIPQVGSDEIYTYNGGRACSIVSAEERQADIGGELTGAFGTSVAVDSIPLSARLAFEIYKPKDPQAFQRNCVILFRAELNDPNAQEYGRNGQKQNGIDILGKRNGNPEHYVGVQCRLITSPLKESKILSDCRDVLNIEAGLKEIIFASTAPNDVGATNAAIAVERTLRAEGHDLTVVVYGWDQLSTLIAAHPVAHAAFCPSVVATSLPQPHALAQPFSPDFASQIALQVAEQLKQFGVSVPTSEPTTDSNDEDPALHAKIDAYRDLFKNDKELLLAQEKLLKLLESEHLDTKPWARFRIESNLGAIAFELGNEAEGVERYEASYSFRPDSSHAIANLALVRIIQGHFDEAMELAQRALAAQPRADHAVGFLLQAAAHSSWEGDPEMLIPLDLIGHESADIGLAEFLRRRNIPGWEQRTLELSHRHPTSDIFKRLRSLAVLSLAVDGEGMLINDPPVFRAEIETAADDLKALTERYLDIGFADHAELMAHLNNASLLLRISDRHSESEALLSRGIKVIPPEPTLIRLLALARASEGRIDEAAATLEGATDLESQIFRAELVGRDNPVIALEELLKIDPTHLKPRQSRHYWELTGELALKTNNRATLDSAVAVLREQFSTAITADLLELRAEQKVGLEQAGVDKWLRALAAGLPHDADIAARYFLAEEMCDQGLPEEASRLLESCVDLSRVHPVTMLYLRSLAEARRDQAFRDALAAAAPVVREDPAMLWTVASHAWNTDDLDSAYSAVENLLAQTPDNARARRLKIEILIRQNRTAEIFAELDQPIEKLDWKSTEEGARIATLLGHFGYIERAAAFAYQLFLKHRDEPPAWMALLSTLLNHGCNDREDSEERWHVNTIAPNAAVDLTYEDGERLFFIVESDASLRQLDESSWEPEHRLVTALVGLKEKQNFVGLDGRKGTVEQLRHKYIARLHYIMEGYEKRFPEIFGIRRITVDPTQPDGLDQFIAGLKAINERVEQEQERYLREGLPLGILAHRLCHDSIEVSAGLAKQGIPVKVAYGSEEERNQAFNAMLQNARRGCVFDLWALWIVWRLGALELVIDVCGPIRLPQSVMDRLRYRRVIIENAVRDGMRSASYEGGQIALLETPPETVKEWLDDLDKLIAWAESHTTICPLVVGEDLPPELRKFLRAGDSDLLDSLILAQQKGVLLITDDLPIRNIGREIAGVPGTWLHPIFWMGREQDLIDLDVFTRWTANLVAAGQDYTSVTGEMLVCALQLDAAEGKAPGYYFKILTKTIGGKNAEPLSHLHVCVQCLAYLWGNKTTRAYRAPATGLLIQQLVHDRKNDYALILRSLIKLTWDWAPLRRYILGWVQGHFLLQDVLTIKNDPSS